MVPRRTRMLTCAAMADGGKNKPEVFDEFYTFILRLSGPCCARGGSAPVDCTMMATKPLVEYEVVDMRTKYELRMMKRFYDELMVPAFSVRAPRIETRLDTFTIMRTDSAEVSR